jgi:hypothetical protein
MGARQQVQTRATEVEPESDATANEHAHLELAKNDANGRIRRQARQNLKFDLTNKPWVITTNKECLDKRLECDAARL